VRSSALQTVTDFHQRRAPHARDWLSCPVQAEKAASGNLDARALPYGYRDGAETPESTRIEPITVVARNVRGYSAGTRHRKR
jgi:hypothetical protein